MKLPGGIIRLLTGTVAFFITCLTIFLSFSPHKETETPDLPALAVRPTLKFQIMKISTYNSFSKYLFENS